MPDYTNPRWWMNPRPFGSSRQTPLEQARQETKFFAKQARKTISAIHERRELFHAGRYAHVAMVEIDAMFDSFAEDLHFYLGRRRTWFAEQLKLERQQPAPSQVAAE